MTEPLIASINVEGEGHWRLCCHSIAGAEVFELALDYQPCTIGCSATEILIGGEMPNQICVFDFFGQLLQTIQLTELPRAIAVHKSGWKFACGFHDGDVVIYEKHAEEWSLSVQFQTFDEPIYSLIWFNDQDVCICNADGSVSTWDASSGLQNKDIQSPGVSVYCRLSPITADGRFLFSGYLPGMVRRHKLEDCSSVQFKPHSSIIQCICINDNNGTFLTCSIDHNIIAFDIESLAEKWRYRSDNWPLSLVVHNEEVFVAARDSFIIVLNADTGEFIRNLDAEHKGDAQLALQRLGSFSRFKFED